MKVRYLTNACVVIETPDCRIITDPWLSETCHYGSWSQWPPVGDMIERVGPVDLIWISHIHQDHCDIRSIRELLRRNPDARVVVADFKTNHLAALLKRNEIEPEVGGFFSCGMTEMHLLPADAYRDDVDGVLVVKRGNQSIVHWNDCPADPGLIVRVKAIVPDPTCALLPYTGASNWPQCYYDIGSAELTRAMEIKRVIGLTRWDELRAALRAKVNVPFAGQYVLSGRFWHLNPYRGNIDATEIAARDENAVVLADGGEATLDLDTMQASAIRARPYDQAELMRYALSTSMRPMDYEIPSDDFKPTMAAARYAWAKSECRQSHWYCFVGQSVAVDVMPRSGVLLAPNHDSFSPRSEIYIDDRAFAGALAGRLHWSNLAGGSHFMVRRHPDVYEREVDDWLNHFHV